MLVDLLDTAAVSAVVTAASTLIGVFLTLRYTGKQESARLEAESERRLRDERIAAYRKVLATVSTLPKSEEDVENLMLACSEAALLAESRELIEMSGRLQMKSLVALARGQGDRPKTHTEAAEELGVESNPPLTEEQQFQERVRLEHLHQRSIAEAQDDWRQARQEVLKLCRKELGLDPTVVPEMPRTTYN